MGPSLASPSLEQPPLSAMSRRKNTKRLSLSLPADDAAAATARSPSPSRRLSTASLPSVARPTSSLLHRMEEEGGSPTVPYTGGPVQIIPGVWLGSEDNARDWKSLIDRGIRSILNVAKEVSSPFDALAAQPLRSTASVPDLRSPSTTPDSTYYPPHIPSGRPGMHYLKLQWSHGQKDLVNDGFQAGIVFTDAALARGDGILVHCQCGISRSATMLIALVMRAAALCSPSVPPEVWDLKGMQAAYAYVKDKSKWIGPNMSLIYELLDYEKKLKADFASPAPSDADSAVTSEEETWTRQRQLLDETPSDTEPSERDSFLVMQEARDLDKAMESRIVARKSSASSIASAGSGLGMGPAWRSRYSTRKRAGSIASNVTNNSIISENLVEEEEEPELLGVGGGFDDTRERRSSADTFDSSATNSPDDDVEATPRNILTSPFSSRLAPHLRPPPSAPAWKQAFDIPHIPPAPLTAVRSTFDLPPKPKPKARRRPPPIGLPPVPSSPVTLVTDDQSPRSPPVVQPRPEPTIPPTPFPPSLQQLHSPSQSLPNAIETPKRPPAPHRPASLPKQNLRPRAEARRPSLPPQHLRKLNIREPPVAPPAVTPHQTLFVFPPSPTLTMRTPSAVMLTTQPADVSASRNGMVPFPSISTPKISTFRQHGRTKSFIGVGTPMTPTTAFTKAEARGYFGLE